MFQTFKRVSLDVQVTDTTVAIGSGTARINNALYSYDGTMVGFNSMVTFGGDASKYQNVLLYLQDVGGMVDMTRSVSAMASSISTLDNPGMDASSTWSGNYPVGRFTFYTSDGTTPQLVSYI